ncbi:MAG TPA: GatB/YqeY domain-containing protein, partial [Alphaproteobacteria bacterium]|nr:GatB/YqeY domain-containing protein [Alphaproteobacteria bacterium]
MSIEESYKEAIKSKKLEKANTLRLIKSAIKDKDIENRASESSKQINDHQILALLQNLIKQRKDSIESFKIASRVDLIAQEELEIDFISQFLPKQLNEKETEEIIKEIIKKQRFSSLKDMGALINNIKSEYAGSV